MRDEQSIREIFVQRVPNSSTSICVANVIDTLLFVVDDGEGLDVLVRWCALIDQIR